MPGRCPPICPCPPDFRYASGFVHLVLRADEAGCQQTVAFFVSAGFTASCIYVCLRLGHTTISRGHGSRKCCS